MSEEINDDNDKLFFADRAKQGRAACKKCKEKLPVGSFRLAKVVPSPYNEGTMKNWFHLDCLFETFKTQRATTKKIEGPDDIGGWWQLSEEDKDSLIEKIDSFSGSVTNTKAVVKDQQNSNAPDQLNAISLSDGNALDRKIKDNLFKEFRKLCRDLEEESSYLSKTAIIEKYLTKGADGKKFKGDLLLWLRLLLPGTIKRIYNLQSKQLIKLFSRVFNIDQDEMLSDLEQGDVATTISTFFESSDSVKPAPKSLLTVKEVDIFLNDLSKLTREDSQIAHFTKFVKKCTSNDLKMVIRLIKHDLRINAGAKHVLNAIHPDAYSSFQSTRDLVRIVSEYSGQMSNKTIVNIKKTSPIKQYPSDISLMVPVAPMLAEACKSVEQALSKCPSGMYSEIKYDGERVQLHKSNSEFKFFSRSLKPVLPHKVDHIQQYILQAFPDCNEIILDSEVLMIDKATNNPLPFGSLGKYKREEFKDAQVCLFVFDCLYYNGESLTNKTMKERREFLEKALKPVPQRVVLSEMQYINKPEMLAKMIADVIRDGLEGLVLKDVDSIYKPGKRHWLKVKKEYLFDGAMADSADLVVLGAYFGTGKKGGMYSIFLMGCRDEKHPNRWVTVTKVHTGHDDSTLEKIQKQLEPKVCKISKDPQKLPPWLMCKRSLIPDVVAKDPNNMPVWEITGSEFTKAEAHTADGISIRFPRVSKIRKDKNYETATNLSELKVLFNTSTEVSSKLLKQSANAYNNSNAATDRDQPSSSKGLSNHRNNSRVDVSNTPKNELSSANSRYKKEDVEYMDEDIDYDLPKVTTRNNSLNICRKNSSITNIESFLIKRKLSSSCPNEEPPTKKIKYKIDVVKSTDEKYYTLAKYNGEIDKSLKSVTPTEMKIFENIKIFMFDNIQKIFEDIVNSFIAKGGQFVDAENATHVIHWKQFLKQGPETGGVRWMWSKSARHVHVDWLLNCIYKDKIIDTNIFAITLQS